MEVLLPEMILVVGVVLAILVPNIGDAKFRIPLTRVRVPIFVGGTRLKGTSDPRLPALISITAFSLAMFFSFFGVSADSSAVEIGGVLAVNSFSRMMSFVFYAALLLAAVAANYRLPARPSARAPRERDSAAHGGGLPLLQR